MVSCFRRLRAKPNVRAALASGQDGRVVGRHREHPCHVDDARRCAGVPGGPRSVWGQPDVFINNTKELDWHTMALRAPSSWQATCLLQAGSRRAPLTINLDEPIPIARSITHVGKTDRGAACRCYSQQLVWDVGINSRVIVKRY